MNPDDLGSPCGADPFSSPPWRPIAAHPDFALFDLISSLVCVIGAGCVRFLNQAGRAMLGTPADADCLGRPFADCLDRDYRDLIAEAGWEALTEEEMVPLKIRRADSGTFEAELRVRRIGDDGDCFLIEARDISRAVRSAEALREREERLQGVLASVAEGIVTLDERGRIETVNPAVGRIFGCPPAELTGGSLSTLLADSELPVAAAPDAPLPPTGQIFEVRGRRSDDSEFPLELSLTEVRHGKERLFTAILRDISERKEHEERINRLAHHDPLTGLPNRNLLHDRISHALARVRRHGGHLAVLYIDLDRFKPINDHLGHQAGDAVLREVARRLATCVRTSDTIARIGGDEFVVMIEELTRANEAARVARKIIDILSQPITLTGHSCMVGASIGIAVHPLDGQTLEDLCKAADLAMYRVKNTGRNGYRFFSEEYDGNPTV